jgi:UDP-3-O-acyl-N-acetylglucosamine deacetylase
VFRRELASARTFLLEAEAEWLRGRGLGTRVTVKDLLIFGDQGPIGNELRFEDECVRHKTLDLVGDFALAGCEIVGQVIAYRSGHRLNAELVRALLSEGEIVGEQRRTA